MQEILLVVHLILALAIVVVVLLQRSEGGALGIGGGGGGGGSGFMTGRSAGNLLTRSTAILAACFMATSLLLTILASDRTQPSSILDSGGAQVPAPNQEPARTSPSVPLSNQ